METKRLAFSFEEIKADDTARTVEGFGSVFNHVDQSGDIVLPGAFAKSLAKRKPAMLWQHDTRMPIGVWDELEETGKGLRLKGRILPTQQGNDAYLLAKEGALNGLSIGYGVKKYAIDAKKNTRSLEEVELYEVSLVTFPMNDKATITRVKSAHDNERDFEDFLREAGYSRDAAKIITARGFKALGGQREAEAEALSTISTLFNKFKY